MGSRVQQCHFSDAPASEHKALVRRLRKLIGNDAAQDVAQKVWIKIQTVRDSPPIHNQHAYLHRLAHNVAVDPG